MATEADKHWSYPQTFYKQTFLRGTYKPAFTFDEAKDFSTLNLNEPPDINYPLAFYEGQEYHKKELVVWGSFEEDLPKEPHPIDWGFIIGQFH